MEAEEKRVVVRTVEVMEDGKTPHETWGAKAVLEPRGRFGLLTNILVALHDASDNIRRFGIPEVDGELLELVERAIQIADKESRTALQSVMLSKQKGEQNL